MTGGLAQSSIAAATAVSFRTVNFALPYCGSSTNNFKVSVTSDAFEIEEGSFVYDTTTLSQGSLQVTAVSTETTGSLTNSFTITVTHSVQIQAGTTLQLTYPATVTFPTLSCTYMGLDAGASCSALGTDKIRVTSGFTTARATGIGPFKITLVNLKNPRGLGQYSFTVEAISPDCLSTPYAIATAVLVVDKIPQMAEASMVVSNSNRNLFETYTFKAKPKTTALASGDYLSVLFPASMLLSATPVCTKLSANINSLSCTRTSNTLLKLPLTVDAIKYTADQLLEFEVKFVKNPDLEGLTTGFALLLTDSTEQTFENYTSITHTYTTFTNPTSRSMSYTEKKVGEMSTSKLTLQVPSVLMPSSKIVLTYSENFELNKTSTLALSNVNAKLVSVDPATRKITIELLEIITSDRLMEFSITTNNPKSNKMAATDLVLTVLAPDDKQVLSINALASPLDFECGTNCTACSLIYSNCTACIAENSLDSAGACIYEGSPRFKFPPFVFLSIALALSIIVFFVGKVCSFRNYPANLLYSMLKVNFFCFLVLFGFIWSANSSGIQVSLKYSVFGLAGVHLIITWVFFCLVRSCLASPSLHIRNVYMNGHYHKITKEDEISASDDHLEHNHHKTINVISALAFLVSASVFRWLFSDAAKKKAYIWHLDKAKFAQLRHYLECYAMFYFFFFTFPLVAALVYLLYPNRPASWNLYFVEAVCLCLFDLFAYAFAFVELSAKNRSLKYDEPLPANESLIDHKSGILDNTMKEEPAKKDLEAHIPMTKSLMVVSHMPSLFIEKKFAKSSSRIDDGLDLRPKKEDEEDAPSSSRLLHRDNKPKLEKATLMPLFIQGSKSNNSRSSIVSDDTPLGGRKKNKIVPRSRGSKDGLLKPGVYEKKPVDLKIKLPSRQLTVSDDGEEYNPIEERVDVVKTPPKVRLVKTNAGVIQPQLIEVPEQREEFVPPKEEQVLDQPAAKQRKPQVYLEDDGDEIQKYLSEHFDPNSGSIKKPEKSRFKENQLFSKWWFNSSKKYLEIIYEEDEDKVNLDENPEYEDSPKAEEIALETKPQKIKDPQSLDRIINGQLESDLNKGIVRDRNNTPLKLADQKPNALKDGELEVKPDKKIKLNSQPQPLFEKGFIKDIDGRLYRTKDQDFNELEKGVLLTRDGKVDNINGQKPEDIANRILKDKEGNVIDLNNQPADCYEKNSFVVEKPNEDIDTVRFDKPQVPAKLERGVIVAPDGNDYRLRDQDLVEIKEQGIYRDRNQKPLPIEPLHEYRLQIKPKPKKPVINPVLIAVSPSNLIISQLIESSVKTRPKKIPTIQILSSPNKKTESVTNEFVPAKYMPALTPADNLSILLEKNYHIPITGRKIIQPSAEIESRLEGSYLKRPKPEPVVFQVPLRAESAVEEKQIDHTKVVIPKYPKIIAALPETTCKIEQDYLRAPNLIPRIQPEEDFEKSVAYFNFKPSKQKYVPVEATILQKDEETARFVQPKPVVTRIAIDHKQIFSIVEEAYLHKKQTRPRPEPTLEEVPIKKIIEPQTQKTFSRMSSSRFSDGDSEDIPQKDEALPANSKKPIGVIISPAKNKAFVDVPAKQPLKNDPAPVVDQAETPKRKVPLPPRVELLRKPKTEANLQRPHESTSNLSRGKQSLNPAEVTFNRAMSIPDSKDDLYSKYNKTDAVDFDPNLLSHSKQSDAELDAFTNPVNRSLPGQSEQHLHPEENAYNSKREVPVREILKLERTPPKVQEVKPATSLTRKPAKDQPVEDSRTASDQIMLEDPLSPTVHLSQVPVVQSKPTKPPLKIESTSQNRASPENNLPPKKSSTFKEPPNPPQPQKFQFPSITNNPRPSPDKSATSVPKSRERSHEPLVILNKSKTPKSHRQSDTFRTIDQESSRYENSLYSSRHNDPLPPISNKNNSLENSYDADPRPAAHRKNERLPLITNKPIHVPSGFESPRLRSLEDVAEPSILYEKNQSRPSSRPLTPQQKQSLARMPQKQTGHPDQEANFDHFSGQDNEASDKLAEPINDLSSILPAEDNMSVQQEEPLLREKKQPQKLASSNLPHDKPVRPAFTPTSAADLEKPRSRAKDGGVQLGDLTPPFVDRDGPQTSSPALRGPTADKREPQSKPYVIPQIESSSEQFSPSKAHTEADKRPHHSKPERLNFEPKTKTANISRPTSREKPREQRPQSRVESIQPEINIPTAKNLLSRDSMSIPFSPVMKDAGIQIDGRSRKSENTLSSNPEDSNVMYLNLVMDESVDLDLNIEEIEEDEAEESGQPMAVLRGGQRLIKR